MSYLAVNYGMVNTELEVTTCILVVLINQVQISCMTLAEIVHYLVYMKLKLRCLLFCFHFTCSILACRKQIKKKTGRIVYYYVKDKTFKLGQISSVGFSCFVSTYFYKDHFL